MKIELRVLKYFLTAADEGNITRSADILHVTQPTLSRQLMELEDEMGTYIYGSEEKQYPLIMPGRENAKNQILPEHITRSVVLWKKNHLFSQAESLFVQMIQVH